MLRTPAILLLLTAPALTAPAPRPLEVTPAGKKLAAKLDHMKVEQRWLPKVHVDWKTGLPDGKTGGPPTHCSLFVAAACLKLGVPMLEPPPETFLSNKQQEWLLGEGKKRGWVKLKDGLKAQRLANEGVVVVASYRNPDAKKAGHIAMVRPAATTRAEVEKVGPRICQAGVKNANDTDLKTGFRYHKGAFENGEVLFFAYKPGAVARR